MNRPTLLAFFCLAISLVLFPLGLKQPGLPMQLRGEEATHTLMALSLAQDGDLLFDEADLQRLFDVYPYTEDPTLSLTSSDDWQTASFARSPLYALVALPLTVLFGSNSLMTLNMLLLVLAIWWATPHLGHDGLALLATCGFFLMSTAFVYAFWLLPPVLTLALTTLALAWGWRSAGGAVASRPTFQPPVGAGMAIVAGASLGLAISQEAVLAFLALPLAAIFFRRRQLRQGMVWLAAAVIAWLVIAGLATVLGGQDLARHGEQIRLTVSDPLTPLPELIAAARAAQEPLAMARTPWPRQLADALVGRHAGFLPYFPFVLPILIVFLSRRRRSTTAWMLAATTAIAMVAAADPDPTASSGLDLIGNPRLVGLYPAFFFLLVAVRPSRRAVATASICGYVLAAICLGNLLFTPFGITVPDATFQAHTRGFPFSLLAPETALLPRLATYRQLDTPAGIWRARSDQTKIRGDELWLLAGEPVELWLETREPIEDAIFDVRSTVVPNDLEVRFAGRHDKLVAADPAPRRLRFPVSRPDRMSFTAAGQRYLYRLVVEGRLGDNPAWHEDDRGREYLGPIIAHLGSQAALDRDLYTVAWQGCGAPATVVAGDTFLAVARLANHSEWTWPATGAARVRLAYHWLDATSGEAVLYEGLRTDLEALLAPGEHLDTWVEVEAPATPGTYLLEIEPLFERVAWFSSRRPDSRCRSGAVEVVAGDASSGEPASTDVTGR